ncbi:LysE family translocator [Sphingomonas quercus]|uniref:LysE family translocator n=1 Tax=Sphingomonas quercus TaxID=2842451 RepID=A0ABS6BF28_9SPHN|nr:LysE family translocator [Sphingomonas quercus]MBU3076437.1 LysE family translocator [Sphingomonas quercus]
MSLAILIALAFFCMVASVTPGPNNMMLLASGATFGLKRTLPHMIGISGGCALMVLVLGWGVAGLIDRVPSLYTVLHVLSTIYLLWLAWRIATASGLHEAGARGRPFSLLDAAAFQWVNPKAWALVLGAVASFARPGHMTTDVPVIAAVLVFVGFPCIALWAGAGSVLKRFLRDERALRIFNVSMAALLVLSIAPSMLRDAQSLWASGQLDAGRVAP